MAKEYTLIGGNGTVVSPLEVTESGTYEAGDSRAFNPVKVNVPSGSSTLSGLTDVDISNPSDGQTLVYNASSGKWENGADGTSNRVAVTFKNSTKLNGYSVYARQYWSSGYCVLTGDPLSVFDDVTVEFEKGSAGLMLSMSLFEAVDMEQLPNLTGDVTLNTADNVFVITGDCSIQFAEESIT